MDTKRGFVVTIALVALVITSSVGVGFQLYKEAMYNQEAKEIENASEDIALGVDSSLGTLRQTVRLWSQNPNVADHGTPTQEAALRQFVRQTEFTGASVISSNGTMTNIVAGLDKDRRQNLIGSDFGDREYFRRAIEGETYVSKPFEAESGNYIITVSTPIEVERNGTKETVGTLNAAFHLTQSNFFEKFTPNLEGEMGLTIYSAHGSKIYEKRPDPDFDLISRNVTAEETGWIVSVHESRNVFTSTVHTVTLFQIVALLLVLVALVGFGMWVYRQSIRQMEKVLTGFELIEEREYGTRISLSGTDEWNRIERGFNETSQALERTMAERERKERELDEKNTVLRTVLESLPMGVLVEDESREVLAVNSVFVEMMEIPLSPEELEGYDCEAASHEVKGLFRDSEGFVDGINRRIESRDRVTGEKLELEDGRVLERDYVPYELDGEDAILWVYRDVTQRERRKKELEETRDRLEEAQRVAEMGHWVSDFENTEWSDEVYRIFGVEVGEINSTYERFLEFVHPDDRDRVEEAVDEALEKDNYDTDHRIVRPDGEVRVVHEKGDVYYEDGDPVRILGTVQDITDERQLELIVESVREIDKKILQADDRDEILESTVEILSSNKYEYEYGCTSIGVLSETEDSDGYELEVVSKDSDGHEIDWEEAYSREYIDEVLENGVLVIEDTTQPPFQHHDEEYHSHTAMAVALSYDDDTYGILTVHLPSRQISDEEKSLIEGLAQDISVGLYSIDVEERMRKERDELEVLNRILRHDIRNDMNLVLGWGDVLRDHVDDDGEEYLETVLGASQHVVDLTKTARDFVEAMEKEKETEIRPVSIPKILEDSVETRRESYTDAEFEIDGEIPEVEVEANDLLSTVFKNLLNNAIQHNDKPTPKVEIEAEETDGEVVVSVADNGPGVPNDQKKEIFGKGEKGLESEGTGIGLYLVQTLVEEFGGDVWVEDNDPEGSVFNVRLRKSLDS